MPKLIVRPSTVQCVGSQNELSHLHLEIQKFGIQKMFQMKIFKIQIRSAKNVGEVWISRKKTFPGPFGAIPGNFIHGPNKNKKC